MTDVPLASDAVGAPQGEELYALVKRLYPICRSITGQGLRQTLDILSELVPLARTEVPSGTPVLDWTVPNEWNIRDAYIEDSAGKRVVDFAASNLHVVNYSTPVRRRMTLAELRPHLHTLPEQPELIPYRTSYYAETWGFCLSQAQLDTLAEGEYDVCIDSSLEPGALSYGEFVVPGQCEDEVLISTHVCHPSLCDDNLSGVAISVYLARELARLTPRYTHRFLYAPGTIGAITWLAQNRATAPRVKHGLTLTCLGDSRPFTYKRSVRGDSDIDRAAGQVLSHRGDGSQVIDFFPYGYDERQYNSPGFRLPVGSLMRGRHGQFAEYHTSADNLEFVSGERMLESYRVLSDILRLLDENRTYQNLAPFGEPQLGKRGLYRALGGNTIPDLQLAMLWVLNLSDGEHSVLDIAERSKLEPNTLLVAARLLREHALIAEQ
ncbi:MAG TPA: DUF4910 domain-containing protein [Polyangiaceae bacterium]|nr:DUF4910 domain-containing protein [Polyangiaceae bacterium]